MTGSQKLKPLVLMIGPTAVGKTEVSIVLAEALDGEIIGADSRQLYRGMDIGTAKPSLEDRQRVPHHLLDVADPAAPWSLVEFRKAAEISIDEVHRRNRLPFLVGGTGLYVKSILEGWKPPPRLPDDSYRQELETIAAQEGYAAVHAKLAVVDPQRASELDPRNVRRVIRSLEIFRATGRPLNELERQEPQRYEAKVIGLTRPRAEVYVRIDARIDQMLADGWTQEVRRLMAQNPGMDLPPHSAIGYQELSRHVRGELSLDEAVQLIRKASRQFVRRQANWFKQDDPSIAWYRVDENVVESIDRDLRKWLIEIDYSVAP